MYWIIGIIIAILLISMLFAWRLFDQERLDKVLTKYKIGVYKRIETRYGREIEDVVDRKIEALLIIGLILVIFSILIWPFFILAILLYILKSMNKNKEAFELISQGIRKLQF